MKNTVSTFLSMKQNGERLTEITGGRFARHDHDGL